MYTQQNVLLLFAKISLASPAASLLMTLELAASLNGSRKAQESGSVLMILSVQMIAARRMILYAYNRWVLMAIQLIQVSK